MVNPGMTCGGIRIRIGADYMAGGQYHLAEANMTPEISVAVRDRISDNDREYYQCWRAATRGDSSPSPFNFASGGARAGN